MGYETVPPQQYVINTEVIGQTCTHKGYRNPLKTIFLHQKLRNQLKENTHVEIAILNSRIGPNIFLKVRYALKIILDVGFVTNFSVAQGD